MKILSKLSIALLTGFLGICFACTDSLDPETVVQAQIEAYNAHDVDLFASCYAEDVKVYRLADEAPMIVGIEQLRERYTFLETVPDTYKAVIDERMVNGPIVIDRERVVGRGEGMEDLVVFAIYEVRDGKIARVWFPPAE